MDEERRHQQHREEEKEEGDDHEAAAVPVIASPPPRLESPSESKVAGRKEVSKEKCQILNIKETTGCFRSRSHTTLTVHLAC